MNKAKTSIVEDLRQSNDYVLVDGPPLCDYSDAEFLAEHVDSVVLVVRSSHCSRSDLKSAAGRIRECRKRLIGVVLNDIDPIYLPGSSVN